jgi:hypothetical protein
MVENAFEECRTSDKLHHCENQIRPLWPQPRQVRVRRLPDPAKGWIYNHDPFANGIPRDFPTNPKQSSASTRKPKGRPFWMVVRSNQQLWRAAGIAKALVLTVPPSLLVRADEVIE